MTKKILLLGSGELGKEFVIAAQRLGQTVVACDSYAGAPAMQVADACEVFDMLDGDALAAAVAKHRPDIIVPEIEAIRTERLYDFEREGVQVVPSARAVNFTMNRKAIRDLAAREVAQVLPICAKLEQDIAELDDPEERAMFLADLGIEKSGLDRLIQCSYDLLGLISFLTYGKDECRAWTIKKGTKAPQAAGKIHSDIERGFIRAETINFDEMMACGGSVAAAKEKGLLRSEGKEYVVKDGDMIYFRFNV